MPVNKSRLRLRQGPRDFASKDRLQLQQMGDYGIAMPLADDFHAGVAHDAEYAATAQVIRVREGIAGGGRGYGAGRSRLISVFDFCSAIGFDQGQPAGRDRLAIDENSLGLQTQLDTIVTITRFVNNDAGNRTAEAVEGGEFARARQQSLSRAARRQNQRQQQ